MGRDCLDDPDRLARWLDGSLPDERVRVVDRHLLDGCTICWGVLRFVSRLREVVGGPATSAAAGSNSRVILDSASLREAIGVAPGGSDRREILAEMGPWDVRLELRETGDGTGARLDLQARERAKGGRPPGRPLLVEVRTRTDRVAMASTDPKGRVRMPAVPPGPLRLVLRTPDRDAPRAELSLRR